MKDEMSESEPQSHDASPTFEARCVDAALAAYVISKMSQERARTDFVPVAAEEYVRGLGHFADVDVELAFDWAGVRQRSRLESNEAGPWGRLFHRLGVSLAETLAFFRISLAENAGYGPIPMSIARRGQREDIGTLAECEAAVLEIELGYPPDLKKELAEILGAVRAAYRKQMT